MNNIMVENATARALDASKWIEIHLDAIIHNVKAARAYMKKDCKLLVVVKADAYGLGAVEISKILQTMEEVDMLGVSLVEEGVQLRQKGIEKPILVFIPVNHLTAPIVRAYDLIATVDSDASINALAYSGNKPHPCHLKINTGMNMFGVLPGQGWDKLHFIAKTPSLKLEGIYTSLSKSRSKNKGAALAEAKRFYDFIQETDLMGISRGMAHLADSTTFIRFPDYHMDMVRVGSFIYGDTFVKLPTPIKIRNPFYAFARISAIQELQRGDPVGIDAGYISSKKQKIAIVAIGYADGFAQDWKDGDLGILGSFRKILQKTGEIMLSKSSHYVKWQGYKITTVGRIGMQVIAVKVEHHPVEIGDAVLVPLDKIFAGFGLKRYYYLNGHLVAIRNLGETEQ